ncbi:hypothetical protein [uncultured Draconibacterium sp.]|uniref:hypothetical protein n=1 Tax=uncultured Draconibacterium sp. TaxID=1573823 RepID=UPI003217B3CF
MKKRIGFIGVLFVLLMAVTVSAQTKKQKKMAGYTISNYEVECMGTGMDGTQLIKVWGYGKKPDKAVYQAKKNAVHAVIFKGITGGKPGCMMRPLVTKPGAEVQHSAYFETFFTDGGHYLTFVSQSGDGTLDRIKVSNKQYKVGVIVSVKHSALRSELETAGIIKKLGGGF